MFCERLEEAMERRGVKAIDLAAELNCSRGTITRYIQGSVVPKAKRMHEIANILDVQEAWLLGFDVSMDRPDTREKKISEIEKMLQLLQPEHLKIVNGMIQALLGDDSSTT